MQHTSASLALSSCTEQGTWRRRAAELMLLKMRRTERAHSAGETLMKMHFACANMACRMSSEIGVYVQAGTADDSSGCGSRRRSHDSLRGIALLRRIARESRAQCFSNQETAYTALHENNASYMRYCIIGCASKATGYNSSHSSM
jgi:hypothetical protein